jgi:transcriptional pleiotropic regulator of transition state genes
MVHNKKIGKSGGFTIPSSLRRDLGIQGGEKVKIETTADGKIVIERIIGLCLFCKSDENLKRFEGRFICEKCLEKIKVL